MANPTPWPITLPAWLGLPPRRLPPGGVALGKIVAVTAPQPDGLGWESVGNLHQAALAHREAGTAAACAAIAVLRARRGSRDSARRWSQRALELDSRHGEALSLLAGEDLPDLSDLSHEPDWDARTAGHVMHARRHGSHLPHPQRLAPWQDPLLAAELSLADELAEPLPVAFALAAADRLLALGDPAAAARVLAAPLAPAVGVPAALVPFVAAYVNGTEPPWRWELEWGSGFACGRLAIVALEYAVECHDDTLAHYQLGCALAAAGDWPAALGHWAVSTDSEFAAVANRNLGLAAWRVEHDRAAAKAFYREAIDCGAGAITQREAQTLAET